MGCCRQVLWAVDGSETNGCRPPHHPTVSDIIPYLVVRPWSGNPQPSKIPLEQVFFFGSPSPQKAGGGGGTPTPSKAHPVVGLGLGPTSPLWPKIHTILHAPQAAHAGTGHSQPVGQRRIALKKKKDTRTSTNLRSLQKHSNMQEKCERETRKLGRQTSGAVPQSKAEKKCWPPPNRPRGFEGNPLQCHGK